MKILTRHKVCFAIISATLVLCLIVFIALPDRIITGYVVHNGETSVSHAEKIPFMLQMMIQSVLGAFLWDFVAKRNERKITENPNLQSYKIRSVLIDVLGFLFTAAGAFACIGNLIVNIM